MGDVVSVEFEKTLRINAPAEKIFVEASDAKKLAKWIPAKMHDQLIQNAGKRYDIAEHMRSDQSNKRVTWEDGNGNGYKGSLEIKPAGQESEVTIRVQSANPKALQDEVNKYLSQALSGLQKQVVSAGGAGQRR